jgi:hypothetical protein
MAVDYRNGNGGIFAADYKGDECSMKKKGERAQ